VATTEGSIGSTRPALYVHAQLRDWSWRDLPRLRSLLRRYVPDVVLLSYLAWAYKYHPMTTFVPSVVKRILPGSRVVTLFEAAEGSAPSLLPIVSRACRKAMSLWAGTKGADFNFGTLFRDSDGFIFVSERIRQAVRERIRPSIYLVDQSAALFTKGVIIPSPPIMRICPEGDSEAKTARRARLAVGPKEFVLAYFGYIYAGKGVETLLQAFSILCHRRSDVRLVMIGGDLPDRPYSDQMKQLARELKVEAKVSWSGAYDWDSDEASGWLRAADIGVLPFDDGICLHNSSLAGIATHGLPIITTRGETLEPAFVDRDSVYLCPPKNPDRLASAIDTVLDDASLRETLHAGARRLAQDWFCWDRATDRLIETFG